MPYDADSGSDVSSIKEKLQKTYKNISDTAARQAIHVFNSVMENGGDEGRAWASVYSVLNERGLGKKAGSVLSLQISKEVWEWVEEDLKLVHLTPLTTAKVLGEVAWAMAQDKDLLRKFLTLVRSYDREEIDSTGGMLLRLASQLPKGSPERRALLCQLQKKGAFVISPRNLARLNGGTLAIKLALIDIVLSLPGEDIISVDIPAPGPMEGKRVTLKPGTGKLVDKPTALKFTDLLEGSGFNRSSGTLASGVYYHKQGAPTGGIGQGLLYFVNLIQTETGQVYIQNGGFSPSTAVFDALAEENMGSRWHVGFAQTLGV